MQTAILATDLALFFGNKARLESIVKSGEFSWETKEHKYAFNIIIYYINNATKLMWPSAFMSVIIEGHSQCTHPPLQWYHQLFLLFYVES